jgi:hypothetical protein
MTLTINTPAARVENSFKKLTSAAQMLNSASDDLTKVISPLDAALKKLGLGVAAWVEISGNDDGANFWSRDLGYAKLNGKWGIALRDVSGHHQNPDGDAEEAWLFSEAPRWMRIEAVGKIPDLLEKLLQQVEDTAKKLKTKTVQAQELVSVIVALANNASEQK